MARAGSLIAFALDFPSVDAARPVAQAVARWVGMFKVGLELFVADGARGVQLGEALGLPVFLDLKLHDIPETVDRTVARVAALGARFVTVHAAGGPAMLARAASRAQKEGSGLEVVAVTVLTSMDGGELARIGVSRSAADQALSLAKLALEQGVHAFVCSPEEVSTLRRALGDGVTLITPGIRPSGGALAGGRDDQKRVATAARAVADGADWLVVGRPIRDASDPGAAARALAEEANAARERV